MTWFQCQLPFAAILWVKLLEMIFTVISLKYALLTSQWSYRHFHKPTDRMLFKQYNKSSPLNSTHYAMLYPQNGDRIVAVDSVESLHTVYLSVLLRECLWFRKISWFVEQSRQSTFSDCMTASQYPELRGELAYRMINRLWLCVAYLNRREWLPSRPPSRRPPTRTRRSTGYYSGPKKLWNFEARACIGQQKNLDFINKNVRLD